MDTKISPLRIERDFLTSRFLFQPLVTNASSIIYRIHSIRFAPWQKVSTSEKRVSLNLLSAIVPGFLFATIFLRNYIQNFSFTFWVLLPSSLPVLSLALLKTTFALFAKISPIHCDLNYFLFLYPGLYYQQDSF